MKSLGCVVVQKTPGALLHKLDAVAMSPQTKVERSKAISSEGISSALQDNRVWLVLRHYLHINRGDQTEEEEGGAGGTEASHLRHDSIEYHHEGLVVNTIFERKIDTIVLALLCADVLNVSSAWEILTVFVERNRHDAVGSEESFLNTISMVNINVDVENPPVLLQQFQDSKNNIIHVAETRSLTAFSMV
jgi:hypothetical protein